MSTYQSFRPDSRFGVPLNPFPPGCGWQSTLEMVEDAFEDLKEPWVQNFILRSHPRQDVHALNDPGNYNRAISTMNEIKSIPRLSERFEVNISTVRLDIPVISIDNIGVGVGVEKKHDGKLGELQFFQKHQFCRSVSNKRKNSMLILRIQEEFGTIGTHYMVHGNNGVWKFFCLTLHHQSFLDAFDKKSGKVDFQLIHQSITQSIVGGVQHRRTPTIMANHLYPNNVADNTGDHFFPVVVCSYANAQPLRTLLIFSRGSWSHNYDALELRNIQRWAITHTLNRIPFEPLQERLIPEDFLLYEDTRRLMEENGHRHKKMSIGDFLVNKDVEESLAPSPLANIGGPSGSHHAGFIDIAPLPQHPPKPEPEPPANGGLDPRKELRKIRKREAAARSYRRKVATSKKK